MKLIEMAIQEAFGERCPDFEADCPTCQAWREFDNVVSSLGASATALKDWLHLYAPDECRPDDVAETRARVLERGTIAYIAEALQLNRVATDGEIERSER